MRAAAHDGGLELVGAAVGLVIGEAHALGLEDLQRIAALRVDDEPAFRMRAVIARRLAVGQDLVRSDKGPRALERERVRGHLRVARGQPGQHCDKRAGHQFHRGVLLDR